MPWEPQFWDIERWRPQAVFRRFRAWVAASRRRRLIAWSLIALFMLFVFPGFIQAVSIAQTGTVAPASAPNSATGWMDVKDSYGVNVSSYMFVTDRGGVLDPGSFALWILIIVVFAPWLIFVTSGVWLPGKALDFSWLNLFSAPLRGMAENFTAQVATPLMAATAVAIGAVFVGYFIVRGYHAKAAWQVIVMVIVAIGGTVFLADPLAEALSDHGLLVQGRDLGLSVAAGLNGNNNPNPNQLVATLQATMADNFVRRPLQVWNFGHIVDNNPSCRAMWTSGMMAGDEDRVKEGLRSCGDGAAYAAAQNPSVGQVGAGLLLLLCAIILLAFAAYLSIKIMWAALDLVYYGFAGVFGFAAGGYIYGPTQTFTVRCVVHGFISAGKMAFFVIFLGFYELFLGGLFKSADGQVMVVFVIGAAVMVIAIVQLRRLSKNIDDGNDWVVNRIGLAIQSGMSSQGAGSGGSALGASLGMGNANANNSMSTLGLLAAASTINSSPLSAWLAGGRLNPLSPWSWLDHVDKRNKARGLATKDLREAAHAAAHDRVWAANEARDGMARSRSYGRGMRRRAAFAAENVAHATGLTGGLFTALRMAGLSDDEARLATDVRVDIMRHADKEPLASTHLGHVVAAHKHFERDAIRDPGGNRAMARFHGLEASVDRYRGDYSGGVQIERRLSDVGYAYIRNPEEVFITDLREAANSATGGNLTLPGGGTAAVTQNDADRLRQWLSNEHALRVQAATTWVAQDPTDMQRVRVLRSEIDKAAMTNQMEAGRNITGAVSLAQPDIARTPLPHHAGNRDPDEHIPENLLNDLRFRRP
ncbi:hypothetical protein [Nocardia gipuzkoensis]